MPNTTHTHLCPPCPALARKGGALSEDLLNESGQTVPANPAFRRSNADLKRSCCPIPLHAPRIHTPIRVAGGDLRVRAVRECPARSFLREPKGNRGAIHWPADVVGNLDRDPARGSRPKSISLPFAFHDPDIQPRGIVRRRERQERG